MPALPAAPNTVRFTIGGTTPNHAWLNAFHWAYTGSAPLVADADAFASTLLSAWHTNFGPLMTNAATIDSATCVDLGSALGAVGAATSSVNGTRGTAELPGSTAVLIHKTVARRYRGGHPRTYVYAGAQTDLLDPSTWFRTFVNAVDGAYAAVVAALTGHTSGACTLAGEVTVSYVDKAVNPVPPYRRPAPLIVAVLGSNTEDRVATQRRRIGR